MGLASSLASVILAGATMMNTAFDTAKPNMDIEGTIFLVNRQYRITDAYIPEVRRANVTGSVREMRDDAAAALEEMFAACKEETGATLITVSGYRSYQTQKTIYNRKVQNTGSRAKADEYVAWPGASEHQLGMAMDVNQKNRTDGLTASFARTKGGKWMAENCHRFGFILRYQEGWEDITGYKYESWHVRYVGLEHSVAMAEADIPMETYMDDYLADTLITILESDASYLVE
ncbi:MAG: M15 family metallopeptidase [Clostridia bacterium]|nr:M15 family metallopeptidase [Clostridia bacterium]